MQHFGFVTVVVFAFEQLVEESDFTLQLLCLWLGGGQRKSAFVICVHPGELPRVFRRKTVGLSDRDYRDVIDGAVGRANYLHFTRASLLDII